MFKAFFIGINLRRLSQATLSSLLMCSLSVNSRDVSSTLTKAFVSLNTPIDTNALTSCLLNSIILAINLNVSSSTSHSISSVNVSLLLSDTTTFAAALSPTSPGGKFFFRRFMKFVTELFRSRFFLIAEIFGTNFNSGISNKAGEQCLFTVLDDCVSCTLISISE